MGITSGHHTCPGRITNRGLAVSIIEKCTHLGYSVDIWSFGLGVSTHTTDPVVQIIN